VNKLFLIGRLTRDPEIRYTQGETALAIANFSIAVNRKYKHDGEPEADFFNCTAFGRQAEFVEKYLKQGTKIVLTGRIQNNNYTNKNGEKVYSVQVLTEEIEFAENKNASSGQASTPAPQPQPQTDENGFMNIPDNLDEELPFN